MIWILPKIDFVLEESTTDEYSILLFYVLKFSVADGGKITEESCITTKGWRDIDIDTCSFSLCWLERPLSSARMAVNIISALECAASI